MKKTCRIGINLRTPPFKELAVRVEDEAEIFVSNGLSYNLAIYTPELVTNTIGNA